MFAILYDLISTLPISIVTVLLTRSYFAEDMSDLLMYIAALLATALCTLFRHLKLRGRIMLTGIALAVLAGMMFARRSDIFDRLFWIIPVLFICAISFVIGKIADRNIKFKAILSALFFMLLISMMLTGFAPSARGIFISALFYILLFLAEAIQSVWKKEGDPGIRAHAVYMLPFILAVIIPVAAIKAPAKPYDWKFFKDLAKNIRVGWEVMVQSLLPENGWDSGDTFGFSERADIGGKVGGDPYAVLSVSSDTENDYRIYLSGMTFDTFDGKKWTKTDESDIDEKSYDVIETIAAVKKIEDGNTSDFLKNVRLHIVYEGIRTKHVFTPAKTIPEVSSMVTVQKGGDMMTKSRKKSDYIIKYFRINKDDPAFRRLLAEGITVTESDREAVLSEDNGIIKDTYSAEGYEKYRALIDEVYAGPVELTERTKELMSKTLEGADSDAEKLSRIEKLLSSYEYTRSPGSLPQTIASAGDFLDHLLFEQKKGFCTHFATAFVLLARSEGIPARYVQGYSTLSNARKFEIASDRTHAWPEAYIEGVGWIGYEPTPGYKQRAGWDRAKGGSQSGASESVHSTYEGEHDQTDDTEDTGKDAAREGLNTIFSILGSRWVKIVALAVAVFLILFFVLDKVVRRYRYSRMGDTDKILSLCRSNMKMLRKLGLKTGRGETLGEFRERIAGEVPRDISDFTETYEEILYSGKESFTTEVIAMEESNRRIKKYVISAYLGRLRLFQKKLKKNEI